MSVFAGATAAATRGRLRERNLSRGGAPGRRRLRLEQVNSLLLQGTQTGQGLGALVRGIERQEEGRPGTGESDVPVSAIGDPIADMGAIEFVLPGDSDFDYDVDLADYLFLLQCTNGPGAALAEDCHPADLDLDGDGDLADVVLFQSAFTGSQ